MRSLFGKWDPRALRAKRREKRNAVLRLNKKLSVVAPEQLEERRLLAFSSTLSGSTATMAESIAAADTLIITVNAGNLQHNRFTAGDAGFESDLDWNSTVAGNQTLAANAASVINLDTGTGADNVNWGNATIAASSLLATLNYNAGGNSGDILTVNDGASATGKTYSVQSTSMTATGIVVNMVSTTITGGKTMRTSSGVDTVNVITVAASEPVTVTTSGGADNVNIGNVNGVQNIAANVTVSNPTGGGVRSNLTIDNTGNVTAQTANISDTGVTTFSPGAINFNGNEIATLTVRGGSAADTFNVTPTAINTLNFNIQGANPTTVPGDTLNVNLATAGSPNVNSTGTGAGNITFGNRTAITFSEIERLTSGGTGSFAVAAINATAGDDAINVSGNGTDTIVTINGNVVFRGPTSEIAGPLAINGLAGNDTLTGNFTNGNPIPAGNLTFDAGAGGNDAMVLTGGSFNTVRHFFTNANDGRVEIDGDSTDDGGVGETRLLYVGLDPIVDNMGAVNRVFTFNNGNDTAVLGDDPTAGNNMLRISTTNVTSETVDFTTPTGNLTVNLDSGGVGNDTITLLSFDSASVLFGNVTINGGSGADTIIGNIVTPASLVPNIFINGDADSDEVRILATPTSTSTNVDTGSGATDRVFIGGNLTLATFNTGLGSLANLRGVVNVTDSGGIGELYVDDTGNATSGTWTQSALGAVPVFGGLGLQLTKVGITGVINYTRAAMSTFQLALGAGNDTINVNSTNGQPDTNPNQPVNTIFANAGNDTFVIAGDGLGGNNDFRGNLGVDQFTLNITTNIGGSNPNPINSLTLRGDDPAGNSTQRDRVTINDNSAASRFLNYLYTSASAGNMDIQPVFGGSGLFGPADLSLQLRTMETVVFNSANNNDFVNVTGTTADDLLTVAVRNNNTSALVFRGGTPYLDAPPVTIANSRPGVAGGGSGPDLFIQGMTAASGIFLSGGGAGANGDRAIVYGASEASLVDVGNPTDIFGLGAGVLQPGFGAGNAYDTITVTDANVYTVNNSAGNLTPVLLNTATFVQSGPPATQNAGLVVDGGDEAGVQANNRADLFNATISSQFFIQVNGNLPNLTLDVFGNPQGDELSVTVPGSVNVFSDSSSPPNVTVSGIPAITGNFGITFSSIERATFSPTNGVVNIIGDNNSNETTQNDLFVVRGRDVDGNNEGQNEFSLQISGNKGGGNAALSSPIFFNNVTRINASGGEAAGFDGNGNAIPTVTSTGVDTLDLTPYADNTPRGWGIETYFNEGDPILDGDLLIFNGVLGVSDAIVVAPSGPEAGQVFDVNAATGTPIAVVNYTLNTDIIVNASAPPATPGDTDTLALRGTNPANGNTTGNDFFSVDFDAAGTPAAPLVVVTDNNFAGPAIYTLQNLTNFATVTFEMQGGNDNLTFRTPAVGTFTSGVAQAIVLGGAGDDNVTVNVANRDLWHNGRLTYDGGTGVDTLNVTGNNIVITQVTYTPGPIPGNGQIAYVDSPQPPQIIDFVNLEPVNDDTTAQSLIVNGDNADNAINYGNGGVFNGNLTGLVSIDNQEFIRFANKGSLTINGGAGSDTINLNNPTVPAGLGNITVNAGDPTGSDTLIINGRPGLQDQYRLLPTAQGNGAITSATTIPVQYSGIEHIQAVLQPLANDYFTVDGTTGNDDFHFATSDIVGSVQITGVMNNLAGTPFSLPIIDVTGNSQSLIGTLNFNGVGGNDRLTVVGINSNETFTFGRATATSGNINQLVNGVQQNFIGFANFGNITVESQDGDDVFNVLGDFPTALTINGGAPDAGSDVLNFTGTGGNVTIDLAAQTVTQAGNAPISFTGIETLNVNAAAGNLTILGTANPDSFDVTPGGNNTTAIIKLASLPTLTINASSNVGSLLTLNPLGDSDTVRVNGQSDNDTIAVVRGGNTTVQVDALKLITLAIGTNEALVIASGLGDDIINVTGTGGPASIVVDGGAPTASDTLNIATGAAAAVAVNYGADPSSGVVTDNVAGNVTFANIEHLGLTGAGTTSLTVNGTNGNDAINQSGNLITVNNGADVTFATYPTLTLNGNNGDDVINVRPITLAGVTTFTVNGGDPTASDKLIVNGNATANTIGYNPSDTFGSGNVTIAGSTTTNFTTIEAVVIDGGGGVDTLTHTTPGGAHFVTFTPGVSPDAGTVLTRQAGSGVALTPMSFNHIGASGALINLASAGGREDTLELDGTANSDVFNISGPGNTIQIVTPAPTLFVTDTINTAGILNLAARSLDGDDVFNITGALPFTNTTIDAGNPSASDVVSLSGATGAVTIDLAALTVTGYGGTVSLIGVETLNASAGANAITILGTTGPDNFTVTPTSTTSATTTLASLPTLTVNTTNDAASLLTLNPVGGSDNLRVNGTQGSEVLTVDATTVLGNTTGFKTVTYSNTENLQVFGLAGNDTFNVTPSVNTTIFIDGGDPIGNTQGDLLNLNPPGGFSIEPGPENDEGGLNAAGVQRVSWDHIEALAIVGGGPGLILGTNGDDDITIIARDSSTHAGTDGVQDFTVSVNQGANILFINQPFLFVDALAGDDDVVVRAPAPNGAAWNVQLTIAGGPPSAVTGDQGDVFEFETPGTGPDTVLYQPLGSDTGNITLDQATDSVIQLVNTFTFAPLGYISSPGGFEDFIYDGEGDNDLLTIVGTAGNDTIVHTPGTAFDEGRFRINSLLGMTYQNLGNGTITANGGNGTDTLVYNGTVQSDAFTVTPGTGNVTLVNSNYSHLPIGQQVGGNNTIENLALMGLANDDVFNIAGSLPYLNTLLDGGDPSSSDVLNLSGATAATATFNLGNQTVVGYGGLISLLGTETVNATGADAVVDTFNVTGWGSFQGGVKTLNLSGADAGGNDSDVINVTATGGLDTITYTPLGTSSARFDRSSTDAVINITAFNATGNLTLDAGGSSDQLNVVGSSRPDLITAALVAGNPARTRLTFANNPGGGGLWVPLEFLSVEALDITGGDANDRLDVDNTNGLVAIANGISWDGGIGNDSLRLIGTTSVTISAYNVGPNVNQGSSVHTLGGATQRVFFNNLEPVIDLVAAPSLVVNATNADNAINYSNIAGNGLVSIDGFETVEFANKVNLTINALAGSDTISLNNGATPAGLTSINVNGADPTGSDHLIVNGVATTTTITLDTSTITGASGAGGAVPIIYSGIEDIKVVAGNSTTLAVANSNATNAIDYSVTPGVALDEGLIQPNTPGTTIPITYKGFGAGSFLSLIADALDGDDSITVNGTAANDTFTVAPTTGNVTITGRATITPTNVENLTMNGLTGDDTFNITGGQPYAQILVSGGEPSASDVLNLAGATTAVVVNLGDASLNPTTPASNTQITGYGGTITLSGVEVANLSVNGNTLTANGTTQPDTITYTPTGVSAGTFVLAGLNTTFNFTTATSTFTINGGAGADVLDDQVIVNGTNNHDFITVNSPTRTVTVENAAGTVYKPVVLGSLVEIVTASAGFGNDTILVIPAPATVTGPGGSNGVLVPLNLLINVDGGAPNASDALVVAQAGGAPLPITDFTVINRSRIQDAGVVRVFRSAVAMPDIVYSNVEVVSPIVPPVDPALGDPQLLILGPDLYEQNEFRATASFLGNTGNTINVTNLAIFPNVEEHRFVPADEDWFRVVAQKTGTLDFQIYFRQFPVGLLPQGGDIDIEVRDASGDLITGFGVNDGTADERRRIPAVAGQTYFIRVRGANASVVNGYSMSIINEAPPVPFGLELEDVVVGPVTVASGASTTTFNAAASALLSTQDDFYNGKYIEFLSGNVVGQRGTVLDYIGATRTFIVTAGTAFSAVPAAGATFQIESTDTGRSQFDNHTRDNTPTIFLRLDDGILLNDIQGNTPPAGPNNPPNGVAIPIPFRDQLLLPGYRIAIFDEGSVPPQNSTAPQTPVGFATNVYNTFGALQQGVYAFTFTTPLSEGSHFLTARVQIIDPSSPTQTGFADRSLTFEIVVDTAIPPIFFGLPGIPDDGLDASSDSGVILQPNTFSDNITNDNTPTFFGTAEANSVVRLYVDLNANNVVDANDVLIAQTVASPFDGTNQFPSGRWVVTSNVNLNDPRFFNAGNGFPAPDGLRHIMATAEDVSGNVTPNDNPILLAALDIFLDTTGPRVEDVFTIVDPTYELFDPKPSTAGPTPLIDSIDIVFLDLPIRGPAGQFVYPAVNEIVAETIGNYDVIGDQTGHALIVDAEVITTSYDPDGVRTTVRLTFDKFLPDDRFTLVINDSIVDDAGNNLDGESQANSPFEESTQQTLIFPSGDGQPGGDFSARFTVDTRPEIGMYAAARVSIDINGNFVWDPEGQDNDTTNRDLEFALGVAPGFGVLPMNIQDAVFAGNFHSPAIAASGFDKLAAYGFDTNVNAFRWLIDVNHDGIVNPAAGDVITIQPAGFQINGIPFAGDWAPGVAGDEIGLYDGTSIWLDTNGDNVINGADTRIFTALRGLPLAGDFDGDGNDDFATWKNDFFSFDLNLDGFSDATISYGFPGVSEKPIAADMDQDGITDVGLMVPGRSTTTPPEQAEWFMLLSNDFGAVNRIPGTVNTLNHPFSPVPLGVDLYAHFGDEFALPLVGNFDPPVTSHVAGSNLGVVHAAKSATAATVAGVQTFSYQTMRAGTLSVDVSSSNAANITVQLLDKAQNVIASAVSNAQGKVHFDKALAAAGSGVIKVLGNAQNVIVNAQNLVNEDDLLDVNRDGHVTAIDLVRLVSRLNTPTQSALSMSAGNDGSIYFDTNQDGYVTAIDLLKVTERLNRPVAPASSSLSAPASSSSDSASSDTSDIAFAASLLPTKTLLTSSDAAVVSANAAAVDSVFNTEDDDYQAEALASTYATSDDEEDATLITDLELNWLD